MRTLTRGGGGRTGVLRGTALLIGGNLVMLLVGFALTPVTLHYLGTEGFAIWAVVGGLVLYFATFDFGLGAATSRLIAVYYERGQLQQARQISTLGFVLYPVMGLVLTPVLVLVAPYAVDSFNLAPSLRAQALHVLWWSYVLVFTTLTTNTFRGILFGVHRSGSSVAGDVVAQVGYATSLILLLRAGYGLDALIIASFLRLLCLVAVWWPRSRGPLGGLLTTHFDRDVLRGAFSFSGWLQVNGIALAVNMQTDRLVIGSFVSIGSVTPYELANRVALLVRTLPLQIVSPLIPAASSLHARGDEQGMTDLYYRYTRVLALLSLALAAFMAVTADPFLHVWIGERVPDAVPILWVLILTYMVTNLTNIATSVVQAAGEPRYTSYYVSAQALANIVLTVALTPWLGLWGVLIGTVVSTTLAAAGFMVFFHRHRALPWRPVLDPFARLVVAVVLACVPVAVVLHLLTATAFEHRPQGAALFVLLGALYTVVLLPLLVAVRFFTADEVAAVRARIPVGRPA